MEAIKNLGELENAVVVTLSPSTDPTPDVATFEQAFGEHSELFGKMKAKAAKRKDARQAKKMKRIENRGKRKAARQSIRAQQQEARQTRKDVRKTRKVARKELEPVEPEVEEPQYEEPEYQDPAAEYEDPAATDESYVEEEYAEEEYTPEGEEAEYFEGEEGSSAEGNPEIHSEIQGITEKIVWNKEAARRQNDRKQKLIGATKVMMDGSKGRSVNRKEIGANAGQIKNCDMAIQKYEDRIKQLKEALKKFGDHPHIKEGYRQAESKLQKTKEGAQAKVTQAKVQETLVDPNLGANIGYQRIEVPAANTERSVELKSGFDGPAVVKTLSPSTKLLIGVAVVGIALVVAKKYKWI